MTNHKDLISLKQVKNTMKIDRTFSSFKVFSSYHFIYTQTYLFVSILILKFDQPQTFEKKPYKNYYFLVSYACVELFLLVNSKA